ncbi:MAG: peptidoglycan DD-metalloendopeptidase family protein [Gammaproteobacteria bacterium]|nr:peptidoglycan DD-metalloendopeptidase family protein [Gammaproteobacteria bacterium]MBU1777083.1 peptidoglycan DD-metalloendopeptidase family protein [Gammaproteobacteria bacterium]MBU1968388.1 peptidoglycan DD-metalloendopeptidase family protein [Gammaproteobacteria bacterium]
MTVVLRSVLLTLLLLAGTAHAGKQEDLEKLRKRIAALQQEFEKTSESRSEAADELRESERAVSDSNRRLHQLAQQEQAANRELKQLQQRAAAMEREMQGQQARLGRLLYQQYLDGGEQEYLRLLLNNDDPNQVARELHYYRFIARDRASAIKSLRNGLLKQQEVTDQAKRKSDEIASLRAEEQEQRRHLERDKLTHQQMLQKIASQLRQQRREIGRLQKNENRLSQLVEKLAQVLPADKPREIAFRSLKGKLALPVKGKLRNQYGTRRPESTLSWTGWFLRAPARQPVKAVAAGQVVYADWLRGFGNLLIVDHGQGYMSLYANNETLYKQVGDSLSGGDIIATVGSSGGNEDSGLYFELRFQGKPFDPKPWVRKR